MAVNEFQNNNRQAINNYHGKSFSVIGDSISTLEGFTPKNYSVFYKDSVKDQFNVKTPQDTWWGKVVNYFGGRLLVNNSWSGCRVTKVPENPTLFPSACSDERTGCLHLVNDIPNVIIVYVGLNDWISGVPLTSEKNDETVFSYAYGIMLQKLRKNYPASEIRCCTLPKTFVRSNRNFQFPEFINGKRIDDFNDAIMNTARSNGCGVISLHSHNTPYSSLDGTHPDDEGMRTISDLIIRELGGRSVAQNFDMRSDDQKKFKLPFFGRGKGAPSPNAMPPQNLPPAPMNQRPSTSPAPNKSYRGANSFVPDNASPVAGNGVNRNSFVQNRPAENGNGVNRNSFVQNRPAENGMNQNVIIPNQSAPGGAGANKFAPSAVNPYAQSGMNRGNYVPNQYARGGDKVIPNRPAQYGMNQNYIPNQYARGGDKVIPNRPAQNGMNQNYIPNQYARGGDKVIPNRPAQNGMNQNYIPNQYARGGDKVIPNRPAQYEVRPPETNSPVINMDLLKDFDEYSGKSISDFSPSEASNSSSSAGPADTKLATEERKKPLVEFIELPGNKSDKIYTPQVCLYYETCDEYITVKKESVKMGRGRDSDVLIKSAYVARHQASLLFDNGCWLLQDNNSTNGSKLNGTQLKPGKYYLLHEGDVMEFADSAKFVFDVTE